MCICMSVYVRDTNNLTFIKTFMKYHGCPCTKRRAAEQQIMDLPCTGVYEADHYHGFMVYVQPTSPRHVQCSKPFLVL